MKNLKIILAVSSLTIATNALAADYILSERYVSNPPATRYFTVRDYVGVSKEKPCSDLRLSALNQSSGWFSDSTDKSDSAGIFSRFGEAATCIKTTLTMTDTGNVYSTEEIQLIWDDTSKSYTSAFPKEVTVDVSKG